VIQGVGPGGPDRYTGQWSRFGHTSEEGKQRQGAKALPQLYVRWMPHLRAEIAQWPCIGCSVSSPPVSVRTSSKVREQPITPEASGDNSSSKGRHGFVVGRRDESVLGRSTGCQLRVIRLGEPGREGFLSERSAEAGGHLAGRCPLYGKPAAPHIWNLEQVREPGRTPGLGVMPGGTPDQQQADAQQSGGLREGASWRTGVPAGESGPVADVGASGRTDA